MIKKIRLLFLAIIVALGCILAMSPLSVTNAAAADNVSDGNNICFTVNPNPAAPGQPARFDARGSYLTDRNIVKYEWNFGDGSSIGTGVINNHTYSKAGTYNVTLTVTDSSGNCYSIAYSLTCAYRYMPVANPGGPYIIYISTATDLNLDGSSSFSPDEQYGNSIVKYEWDINGDGDFNDATTAKPKITWEYLCNILASTAYPADPFTGNPNVPVSLRVTDSSGKSDIAATTLTIYDHSPVAVANWGPQPAVPVLSDGTATVHLDGSESFDGYPVDNIVDWAWCVKGTDTWVHGMVVNMKVDLGLSPNLIPGSGTDRTIILQVTDQLGEKKDFEFDVTFKKLPSQPPVIRFNVGKRGVFIERGEGFSISAAQTNDPDGDWIRSTAWDINSDGIDDLVWNRADTNGDGVLDVNDAGPDYMLTMSWMQMASYNLQNSGQHHIRLMVTDSNGVSAGDAVCLNVFDKALIARATALPAAGNPGTAFIFDGSQSRHLFPGQSIASWAWDFNNDGIYEESGKTVSHTFGLFGTFNVGLKVSDAAGHYNTDTLTVSTLDGNLPPVPSPGVPYSVNLGSGITLDGSFSFDPDANYGDYIKSYLWDINQDGIPDVSGAKPTLTEQQINTLGIGIHRISLKVADSFEATGTSYTTLFVQNMNHTPMTENQTLTTIKNSPLNIILTAADPDGDLLNYSIDSGPSHGVLSGTAPNLIFTPNTDFSGTDSFIFTVSDGKGGTANGTVTITVTAPPANQPPVAEAGPNRMAEQTSYSGGLVTLNGSNSTDDGQKAPLTYNWTWNGGTASGVAPQVLLPPGSTTVTLTVYDGEFSTKDTVDINVVDTTPPTMTLPLNVYIEQTSPDGTASSLLTLPSVSDVADQHPNVTNNAPKILPPGITNVTWTVADASGNIERKTQIVFVQDTTPPTITAPVDISIEQTSPDGVTISFLGTPAVSDAADPNPKISNNAPVIFPVGTTIITWAAIDASGNNATTSQTVTVKQVEVTPVITWANPADITYGTSLGINQLNAASNVSGTFVYTPAAGTVLHAGNSQKLHVDFIPDATSKYSGASKDVYINVTPASLTVKTNNATMVYGSIMPGFDVSYTGFVTCDDIGKLSGTLAFTTSPVASANSPAGNYTITPGGLTSTDYDIAFENGTLTIGKATLIVKADDMTITYGDAVPTFTITITGYVNGEDVSVLAGSPSLALASAINGAGKYKIIASIGTLNSLNYTFSFIPGTLTVNPNNLTVTAKQYIQNMINIVKGMKLNKITELLLVTELESANKALDKNKPKIALLSTKVFMQHVKLAKGKTISSDNATILLDNAAKLCQIIINEYPETKNKDKFAKLQEIIKWIYDKKGKLLDDDFNKNCDRFVKIMDDLQ